MITANTRIYDIKDANKVKSMMKLDSGDLLVEQNSGAKFIVSKDDEIFQSFIVYSVLADL